MSRLDSIPFARLDRQFQSIKKRIASSIEQVLTSGRVLQSREVAMLEERIAEISCARHAVTVNSGTDALIFALKSLGLPANSKIAVTSMSFVASGSSILHSGHKPIFFDVDPETLLVDTASIEMSISKKEVDAILLVHLYGQAVAIERLVELGEANDIPIIEDCAQSLGALRNGRPLGGLGAVGCISFDPTKVIGAYGSGGSIVTDDDALAEHVRALRYHGHSGDQRYTTLGFNSQLDSVQAAILNVKLDYIGEWQARRSEICYRYDVALNSTSGIQRIKTLPDNVHNHHKYVVTCQHRDDLKEFLLSRGIETKITYPIPLHKQPIFETANCRLPNVESASREILSLPIYAELTDEEITRVCEALIAYCPPKPS